MPRILLIKALLAVAILFVAEGLVTSSVSAREASIAPEVRQRFDWLSQNGNSNCSVEFQQSISGMPASDRLQGSCCGPMDLDHYAEQIEGLKQYSSISMIPADPYDVEADKARAGMAAYDLELTPKEQASYDYAIKNADDGGPCCCKCWRWKVYGGLAKLLIREHGFTGWQVAEFWSLSNGCGGDQEHS